MRQSTITKRKSPIGRTALTTGLLAGLLAVAAMAVSAADAGAATQPQLEKAGWTCIAPVPFTAEQHCFAPNGFQRLITEDAKVVKALVFDPSGQDFLGSEINIRDDVFHGQPCPTDPSQTDPVTYEYTDLYPIFGVHYWACHRFDSDHL